MTIIDFSTNPFDFFALITDRDLIAQEIYRIVLNAGAQDFLNEQMDNGKLAYLKAQISQGLQEYEKIYSITSVDATFSNETILISIVVVPSSLSTPLTTTIDIANLTVDYI